MPTNPGEGSPGGNGPLPQSFRVKKVHLDTVPNNRLWTRHTLITVFNQLSGLMQISDRQEILEGVNYFPGVILSTTRISSARLSRSA